MDTSRSAYQALFPIGMSKSLSRVPFCDSPWLSGFRYDSGFLLGMGRCFFCTRIARLHLWNVPGGPPESQTEIQLLFHQLFGEGVFQYLAKTRTTLALSGIELLTQQGMMRKHLCDSFLTIDHKGSNAVVLVDEEGYYLGDWRIIDGEQVRQVIALLNGCLRWFQTHLHAKLISLFSKNKVSVKDLPSFVDSIFLTKIGDCAPAVEFLERQRECLDTYLKKVLGVKKGIESTFGEFAKAMKHLSLFEFQEFVDFLDSLHKTVIFDKSGSLVENRPHLFLVIEKIMMGLEKAIRSVRTYVEKLDVALKIKTRVFESLPDSVSSRAEVDEIRSKLNNYSFLTVTTTDNKGNHTPLGIIPASDLHKNTLGTVTMRDFCNRDETKIPSYLEVISVIDHHKSQLQTLSAPMVIISDAQSSNVLCAELAFQINDQFSLGGMAAHHIEGQLKGMYKDASTSSHKRVLQRLLQRVLVSESKNGFFIDPMREYIEYLHFLYGILDDTDLLTKVSVRDLECVAGIINRLKSLSLKQEVEVITLSDLPRDETFAKQAAGRILKHPDMYSLYRKIYLAREESVDRNIKLCADKKPSCLFVDTKEQNRCARIGQTKLFGKNYPTFSKHVLKLRQHWYEMSRDFYSDQKEIDLYMNMISTVAGAEDLYAGNEGNAMHCDELWLWIPFTEQSIEHLMHFLNAFKASPQIIYNDLSVECYGKEAKEYERVFEESFLPIPKEIYTEKKYPPLAVLKFKAGTINSRKAMITPYLPRFLE